MKVKNCVFCSLKQECQTNIDKYRVAANITEYHIISKLIFPRIIIPKLMMIMYVKMNINFLVIIINLL